MQKVMISFLIGMIAMGANSAFNDADVDELRDQIRAIRAANTGPAKRIGEAYAQANSLNPGIWGRLVPAFVANPNGPDFLRAMQEHFEFVGGGRHARAQQPRYGQPGPYNQEHDGQPRAAEDPQPEANGYYAQQQAHQQRQAEEQRERDEAQERLRQERAQRERDEAQERLRQERAQRERDEAQERVRQERAQRERDEAQERLRQQQERLQREREEQRAREERAEQERLRQQEQERLRQQQERLQREYQEGRERFIGIRMQELENPYMYYQDGDLRFLRDFIRKFEGPLLEECKEEARIRLERKKQEEARQEAARQAREEAARQEELLREQMRQERAQREAEEARRAKEEADRRAAEQEAFRQRARQEEDRKAETARQEELLREQMRQERAQREAEEARRAKEEADRMAAEEEARKPKPDAPAGDNKKRENLQYRNLWLKARLQGMPITAEDLRFMEYFEEKFPADVPKLQEDARTMFRVRKEEEDRKKADQAREAKQEAEAAAKKNPQEFLGMTLAGTPIKYVGCVVSVIPGNGAKITVLGKTKDVDVFDKTYVIIHDNQVNQSGIKVGDYVGFEKFKPNTIFFDDVTDNNAKFVHKFSKLNVGE